MAMMLTWNYWTVGLFILVVLSSTLVKANPIISSGLKSYSSDDSTYGGYGYDIPVTTTTRRYRNSRRNSSITTKKANENWDWWKGDKYEDAFRIFTTTTTASPILYDWNEWNDYFPNKPKQNSERTESKTLEQALSDAMELEKAIEEIEKSNTNPGLYSDSISKSDSYSYSWNNPISTSNGVDGINRYHILVGGFFILAVISVAIRCSMVYCPCQKRGRAVLLIRETALIIAQRRNERTNSEQNLLSGAEPPADDPPKYEDCAAQPQPSLNTTN